MLFELRTYTAADGKMDKLLQRFREHTVGLFEVHGIHSVGYWLSTEDPSVLIYLVRHDGDAEGNWAAFKEDPRWQAARGSSVINGELITDISSVYLTPTDFSPLGP
jgi:hypothetical protein